MIFNRLNTIRWKFLSAALASAVLTAAILYLSYQVSLFLIGYQPFKYPLALVVNHIGSLYVLAVAGPIIFVLLYYYLSGMIVRRLKQVEDALQRIASGNLEPALAAGSTDEIGKVTRSMIEMAGKLSSRANTINSGIGEIASGRFEHRIPLDNPLLSEVAGSINRMAERLDSSIQDERNAERTKNDLITGVSHDLRTPLTSILGFLEVIENDRYQDEVEMRYYVNIAYEKSLSLKKLIDDLFEFTRINNGMPLYMEELDLVGLLQQLSDEFVPGLEKAGMECRIKTGLNALPALGDGNLLVRSFENLISNAIRYGSEGKYVDIEIKRSGDEAVISISNYGHAIPQKDLPYIFERFYRGDRSRSSGGTGLGLAIVKSIIEVHMGSITAQSNTSRTVFEVRLPVKSA